MRLKSFFVKRPYELEKGSANAAFDQALDCLVEGLEAGGVRELALALSPNR